MMMSMRQVSAATRMAKITPLYASGVLRLDSMRLFSVAQHEPARAPVDNAASERYVKSAYERIARKMNAMSKNNTVIAVDDVEEKIEEVVQYFETRLGMTRMRAIRSVALHPMVVSYSQTMMDSKLAWLEQMGIEGEMLTKTIQRYPSLVGKTEKSMDEAKQWFLDLGMSEEKIPYLFMVFPQAASYSVANKNEKVQTLRDFGLSDEHIRRILQRFPQILTGNVVNWGAKVSMMKTDLGMTDENFVKVLPLVPELLMLNVDQIKEKIESLDELFGAGKGVALFVSRPRLIMTNLEEVRRSTYYLNKVAGWPLERIAKNVSVAMRSVDRFIRPRHQFLTSIGDDHMLGCMYWIMMKDSAFIETYPDYPAFLAGEEGVRT